MQTPPSGIVGPGGQPPQWTNKRGFGGSTSYSPQEGLARQQRKSVGDRRQLVLNPIGSQTQTDIQIDDPLRRSDSNSIPSRNDLTKERNDLTMEINETTNPQTQDTTQTGITPKTPPTEQEKADAKQKMDDMDKRKAEKKADRAYLIGMVIGGAMILTAFAIMVAGCAAGPGAPIAVGIGAVLLLATLAIVYKGLETTEGKDGTPKDGFLIKAGGGLDDLFKKIGKAMKGDKDVDPDLGLVSDNDDLHTDPRRTGNPTDDNSLRINLSEENDSSVQSREQPKAPRMIINTDEFDSEDDEYDSKSYSDDDIPRFNVVWDDDNLRAENYRPLEMLGSPPQQPQNTPLDLSWLKNPSNKSQSFEEVMKQHNQKKNQMTSQTSGQVPNNKGVDGLDDGQKDIDTEKNKPQTIKSDTTTKPLKPQPPPKHNQVPSKSVNQKKDLPVDWKPNNSNTLTDAGTIKTLDSLNNRLEQGPLYMTRKTYDELSKGINDPVELSIGYDAKFYPNSYSPDAMVRINGQSLI